MTGFLMLDTGCLMLAGFQVVKLWCAAKKYSESR